MTDKQALRAIEEIVEAYRILREAYHRDTHRESPAKTAEQFRAEQACVHIRNRLDHD